MSVSSSEPWMSHVALHLSDAMPVLRYCRRCGRLAYFCPDPACQCYHHAEADESCVEDLSAEDLLFVPLSAEQIVRYQQAEHQRRLLFWGEDPAWEGPLS